MPNGTKIATCCYCGTRAALVLRGSERHELACSTCGAPLHEMKMFPVANMPTDRPQVQGRRNLRPVNATPLPLWEREVKRDPKRGKKMKKVKSLKRRFLKEAFDVIEDLFD